MDDPAVRMPAFARQVEAVGVAVERHAQLAQPINRLRRAFDHEFNRGQIVQPRARHHRIAHVVFEGVAGIKHRGDPALRPGGRSAGERAFGQHQHPQALRQRQSRRQPGCTGTNNHHIMRLPACIDTRHAQAMPRNSAVSKRDALSHRFKPNDVGVSPRLQCSMMLSGDASGIRFWPAFNPAFNQGRKLVCWVT